MKATISGLSAVLLALALTAAAQAWFECGYCPPPVNAFSPSCCCPSWSGAFYGPGGLGAPDDVEMFVNAETGMKARGVEWVVMSRGMLRETHRDGIRVGGHSTDEAPQRSAYREWKRWMAASPVTADAVLV